MKEVVSQANKVSSTATQVKTQAYSGSAIGAGKTSGGISEILSYLGLGLLVSFFFFRTVFFGMPISKICRMAEWDSIYSAYVTGRSALCDPSIIHLLVPHYFTVAQMWKSGQLPLWNPYSACGTPLIGDIQATVFSPMRLVFSLWPSMYTYNLSLVLMVVGATLFTFALSRQLGLSRWSSALAAMAYALCPYQLFYLELLSGPSYCLFPLTFLVFVRAAQHKTWSNFIGCGLISTLLIVSGHPELSFFGIFFASLLMGFLILSGASAGYGLEESKRKRVVVFAGGLTLAGIIAFCLSAPVLLPFAEFLVNSDCYKYGVGISAYVPWQCVGYHLLQPGFGQASPYLGIVATCLWPAALFVNGKRGLIAKCLFAVALTSFVLMSRVGPMDFILQHPPMLWFVTVYCLPLFLLSLSVMAGIGLDEVLQGTGKVSVVLVGFFVAMSVPFLLDALHVSLRGGDFDLILPHMAFDKTNWLRDLLLGTGFVVVVLGANKLKTRYQNIVPAVVLILAFVGMAALAKTSLPLESKFNYPDVQPLSFLKQEGDRMLSVGPHLLRANTNTVYGIADLRDFNVLFPKRYLQFAQAAGAKLEMFTEVFDKKISHLADLASVKYILSQTPLESDNQAAYELVKENPGTFELYRNEQAMPPAYLVHKHIVAESGQQALDTIKESDFDYSQVVLESKVNVPQIAGSVAGDKVTIKRDGPNAVNIETKSLADGILVLTDTYYPGWQATVDGNHTPILRANYLFRAIVVPKGSHTIRFMYQPMSFVAGVGLALALLLVLVALAIFGKSFIRRTI